MPIRFFLKKVIGIALLLFAIIFGFLTISESSWNTIMIDLELYLLRGVFPLLLANILIDGKKQFVQSIWIKLRLFTFSTLLFPLAIKLVNNINNNPMQNTTTHMFFQAGAIYNWLSFILVFATIFAFLSYLPIYMFGWVKSPTYVRTVFTFSLLIIISLSIMFEMN